MKYRVVLLISILFIVPFGYVVRYSQVTGFPWLHDFLGSVAYEIFWILSVAFLYPKISPKWIAIGVCLATCGVEFLQLWQPPFLEAARSTWLGKLVLGTTFNWFDFISYFVGSLAGWLWLKLVLILISNLEHQNDRNKQQGQDIGGNNGNILD